MKSCLKKSKVLWALNKMQNGFSRFSVGRDSIAGQLATIIKFFFWFRRAKRTRMKFVFFRFVVD